MVLNTGVELGERIKRWREAKGLTQRDLAEAAGISVSAVCLWETEGDRKTTPQIEHLNKVVEVLGISMERFFGRIPKAKAAS